MTTKMYVGNLPFSTTEEELTKLFAENGTVTSAKIVTDFSSGRSKGFGFIEMENFNAKETIQKLNGFELSGRKLRVDVAKSKRTNTPQRYHRGIENPL